MMKTYDEVIEYLYARLPMFTRDGASAIKKNLNNTIRFCRHLGEPQTKFRSIHVAGTNGKGSSSHTLASILDAAGYKTGLYTSPHLVDFRERIRINGEMIPKAEVIRFVNDNLALIEDVGPSFFEVTVALAFNHFATAQVDVAIIEVGLGGRLDSTNIIKPELCLITNIGMDHMNMLGDTLQEIASEKAGIIKENVPVIVSERDAKVAQVFEDKAAAMQAPLRFANDELSIEEVRRSTRGLEVSLYEKHSLRHLEIGMQLAGLYQPKNLLGVWTVVDQLRKQGWEVPEQSLRDGLLSVVERTGLQGRWQTLGTDPWIICDTGHNEDGIREVVANLEKTEYKKLHIVMGAMRDKDLAHILPLLPTTAIYYFGSPDMPRALPSGELKVNAASHNLQGEAYASVLEALQSAKAHYQAGDLIFVGGSTFVVAEVLQDHLAKG